MFVPTCARSIRGREWRSGSNRRLENLFTSLQVRTIVMAVMWRIDSRDTDLNIWYAAAWHTGNDWPELNLEDDWITDRCNDNDRCNDDDVYAGVIVSQPCCTCGVTPGVMVTRWGQGGWDPSHLMWNSVLWFGARPQVSQCITVLIYRVTKCGTESAIFTYLGTISCWGGLQSILGPSPPPQTFFVKTTGCQLFPHKLMIAQFTHPLHGKLDQQFFKSQLKLVIITHYAISFDLKFCTFPGHWVLLTDHWSRIWLVSGVAQHLTKVLCLDASITIVTWDEVCII